MKKYFLSAIVLSALSLSSSAVYAATCDTSTDCELPQSNGSQASWSATTPAMSNIQAQNSVGPNGNVAGSRYYFAATTSNLGAAVAKSGISTSGTGSEVIGGFATNSSGVASSTVFGGVVQNLLGNQAYFFYAQACPVGTALDSAHCSQWAQIGTKSTLPYPTSVFSNPVKPTDASVNTISARTNVPTNDTGFISTVNLEIDDLTNSLSQTLAPIGWAGNTSYTIDSSMYTTGGGFKPNVKYQYKGQVVYPYGVAVPTGGSQIEGGIWTTPVNPTGVSAANVTHCSADLTGVNGGTPADPSYTPFNLCASGTGGSCNAHAIGGTGSVTVALTNLNPNTQYTPQATALVGNGSDNTANGWNNSGTISGTQFTTLDWNATTSVDGVTTTAAVYHVSIGNTNGLVSYQVFLNGNAFGAVVPGIPPATINLTGLTPNTAYLVQIVLSEANCSSQKIGDVNFVTHAAEPTAFNFTANGATEVDASWTDSLNGAGTKYTVNVCTDQAMTLNCHQTTDIAAKSVAITSNIVAEQTYWAQVKAQKISASGVDSAYIPVPAISATTSNSAPTVQVPVCTVSGVVANCTVVAADHTGDATHLKYHWVATPSGTINPNDQINHNATAINFPATGTYQVVVTVTDHDGTGLSATSGPATVNAVAAGAFIVGHPTIILNPDGKTGNVSCVGDDDTTHQVTYNWSLGSGPAAVTFNPPTSNGGPTVAGNSVVTFRAAGTYTIKCTVTNANTPQGVSDVTPSTTVAQGLSGIVVSPQTATVQKLADQQFTAAGTDQFGNAMPLTAVTWSTTGGGNVSGSGVFSSPSLGQRITVTARQGSLHGDATVTVIDYDVSSAKAYPVPFKSNRDTNITFTGLGSDAKIRVYTTSGREVFNTEVTSGTDLQWPVVNNSGEKLASGVYLYVIESPTQKRRGKLIVIQ